MLLNSDDQNTKINTRDLQAAARAVGQQIQIVGASREEGIEPAFAGSRNRRLARSSSVRPPFSIAADRDRDPRRPPRHPLSSRRGISLAGGLISYGANEIGFRQAAVYVGKSSTRETG